MNKPCNLCKLHWYNSLTNEVEQMYRIDPIKMILKEKGIANLNVEEFIAFLNKYTCDNCQTHEDWNTTMSDRILNVANKYKEVYEL